MANEKYTVLNWLTACATAKRKGLEAHVNVNGFWLSKGSDGEIMSSRLFDTIGEMTAFMDALEGPFNLAGAW